MHSILDSSVQITRTKTQCVYVRSSLRSAERLIDRCCEVLVIGIEDWTGVDVIPANVPQQDAKQVCY